MTADLSFLGTEIEGEEERLGQVVPTSPLFIENSAFVIRIIFLFLRKTIGKN
jgi:hypothetical protein